MTWHIEQRRKGWKIVLTEKEGDERVTCPYITCIWNSVLREMRLISIHPAVLLVNYKVLSSTHRAGGVCFRTVFSSFPAHRGETDSKGAFDTLFGALRYRRRDRTRASIWHRRWIFIRARYQIRGPRAKTQISRNVRSQRATRARKSSPARVYAPKWYRRWARMHVAKRHSATERLIFQTWF